VERRVVVGIEPAGELTIVGAGGGFSETWRESDRGSPSLLGAVVAAVGRELEARSIQDKTLPLRLHVDSSAFFGPDGMKLGLGSSAAVAVGTAQALLRYAGLETRALEESTFRAALDGHRSRQRGIGSGYDVAASLYGGCGLFTGGEVPSFEPIALPWMPPFSLIRGAAPVDTSRAVGRYIEWKKLNPRAARNFLETSNEVARAFAGAGNWSEASSRLEEGARLGVELGEAIGVSARIAGLDGRKGKACGAGNEVGALWREDFETKAGSLEDIGIATTGPLWKE